MKKIALVTGASGELGSAIAIKLAEMDYHVLIHANKNIQRAEKLQQQIADQNGSADIISFDICDTKATAKVLKEITEQQPIQILVNNAGIHKDAPLAGMSEEDWNSVIDVNLNGFYNVTQPVILPMITTRWGRVINITSVSGVKGNHGQVNYSAAKAGLIGATKALALEVASRGITVNAVAPGIIESEMTNNAFTAEQIEQLCPMKKAGSVDDVANLVVFLASDKAGYISGQVIGVDGAMT